MCTIPTAKNLIAMTGKERAEGGEGRTKGERK